MRRPTEWIWTVILSRMFKQASRSEYSVLVLERERRSRTRGMESERGTGARGGVSAGRGNS